MRLILMTVSVVWMLSSVAIGDDFKRGDVDGDGRVTISDAIRITNYLFVPGSPVLPCWDAADTNDDGGIFDIPVYLLSYLFVWGSPPPPSPGPSLCGPDPTADSLDCSSYTSCGAPEPIPVDDAYLLRVSEVTAAVGESAEATVVLDNFGSALAGWSFGVCHDPCVAQPISVVSGDTMIAAMPHFDVTQIVSDGWYTGIIISFLAMASLPPDTDQELNVATYEILAPGYSTLTICDGIGDPPVDLLLVPTSLEPVVPVTIDGSITTIGTGEWFRRGDANGDGVFDIADPVAQLNGLFLDPSGLPDCDDAIDTNDDGARDIADAVFGLSALFVSGSPMPPAPGPSSCCGLDPTPDTLDCAEFDCP